MHIFSTHTALAVLATQSAFAAPTAMELDPSGALANVTGAIFGTVTKDQNGETVGHDVRDADGRLNKRQAFAPSTCDFGSRNSFNYVYWDNLDNLSPGYRGEGDACIAYETNTGNCDHPWDKYNEDGIRESLAQVVGKDGRFSTAEVNGWTGGFDLFTTAFADSNGDLPRIAYNYLAFTDVSCQFWGPTLSGSPFLTAGRC